MAKKTDNLTQKNYDAIRDHLWNRIHRTGEEMKNDFPNLLRRAAETEAWRHFTDAEGRPYSGLVEWLHGGWPGGCMMGSDKDTLTYDEALKLSEGHPEVHRLLADNAQKAKPGRKANGEIGVILHQLNRHASRSAVVLGVRLFQDKRDFYEAWRRGEYSSLRAAAIAAGLVASPNLPLPRLKYFWKKAGPKDRKAFRKWMDSKEAK